MNGIKIAAVSYTHLRLQFTDEERATPELETYIKKSEKAADKLDAAKAAIPKQKKLFSMSNFTLMCHEKNPLSSMI